MRNEDDVGGRASASAARRLNGDEVIEILRLGGCEDFASE